MRPAIPPPAARTPAALVTPLIALALLALLAASGARPIAAGSTNAPPRQEPAALPTGQPHLLADAPVSDAFLSPDGRTVVYSKRLPPDEQSIMFEQLFSVPFGGGAATPLMASPAPDQGLIDFLQISPDGARVVFVARATSDGQAELYSVPIGGGAVARLNAPLPAGSSVSTVRFTADSASVVFSTGPVSGGGAVSSELFVAPIAGGAPPRRVHGLLTGTQSVKEWQLSRNGERLVFALRESDASDSPVSLQSVPVAGGTPVVLATYPADRSWIFQVSPDGATVLYSLIVERQGAGRSYDLFKVATTGGTPVPITPAVGGMSNFTFAISPDSLHAVVYIGGTGTPDLQDLYSVSLAGGQPVRLDAFLEDLASITTYRISADSARVVFRSTGTDFRDSIHSVPLVGGPAATFAPQLPTGGGLGLTFLITPDSARVVFYEGRQYFSAPIAGGERTLLADEINNSAGAAYTTNHFITADSAHLFFRGQVVGESSFPLFAVPITGGQLQRLSGDTAVVAGTPVTAVGSPIGFRSSPSGSQVIFRGAANMFSSTALYAVGETPAPPVKDKLLYLPLLRR